MILYGITTDASIGGLFIAGIVPGIIMALVFMAWAVFRCSRSQTHIKRDPRATGAEMLKALRKSIWSIALPVFVLGGMYLGVFTATEAAAAGVWLALRSEEHTSELQSLMRISYAVFCLKKKTKKTQT